MSEVVGVDGADGSVWCRDPVIGGNCCIIFAKLFIDNAEAEPDGRVRLRLISSGHGIEQELAGLRRLALRGVETRQCVQVGEAGVFAQEIGLCSA